MTTINIGCGSDTWGDIRLDYTHRPKEYYLANNESSANIIADAQHLPFIDKCFSELRAIYVLEHVKNWKKALKEWCRVAKKVKIRFPTNSNIAVIVLKSFFQNVDLYQINHLLPNNLKSLAKLREQCFEHLWQIEPKKILDYLTSYGFAHSSVKKISIPVFRMKVPFLKLDLRTTKLTLAYSWDIEAW